MSPVESKKWLVALSNLGVYIYIPIQFAIQRIYMGVIYMAISCDMRPPVTITARWCNYPRISLNMWCTWGSIFLSPYYYYYTMRCLYFVLAFDPSANKTQIVLGTYITLFFLKIRLFPTSCNTCDKPRGKGTPGYGIQYSRTNILGDMSQYMNNSDSFI